MPLLARVKDMFKSGSSAKRKKVYHNVRLDNPEEFWEITGELGDGAYGKVFKAQNKQTKELAALKQVLLECEEDLESFMIEIDILAECKHPNVVELLEAYHYDGKLWMYLEYCAAGAVDSIMVDLDRPLNEKQIAYLCKHLCHALSYIHENKVIHRDLKAGNVLLTNEGGVKLADFGVSAKNKNTYDKRGTFIGTPYWLAPEVILCETFIDAKYDYKADIWSLGISLIEFAEMDPPNHEVSPVRVMLKIQKSDAPRLNYPSRWSKTFNDFISKCLVKDPLLRPSSEELLKHPFLTQPLDVRPIKELLLEYNAEVVEEDVEDENEETDTSRSNSLYPTAIFNDSQFEGESILPLDKKASVHANHAGKLHNTTIDETKEIGQIISPERKISKGRAPKPPSGTTSSAVSHQPSPKKGPAPSVPLDNTTITPTSVASSSKSSPVTTTTTSPVISVSSSKSSPVTTATTSPVISLDPIKLTKESKNIIPMDTSSSPTVDKKPIAIKEESNLPITKSQRPEESNVIAAESRSDDYDQATVTINSQKLKEVAESVSRNSAVINVTSDVEDNKSEFDLSSIPIPMTVCVLSNDDGISNFQSPKSQTTKPSPKSSPSSSTPEPSEVLMASISSEGTVIVRTPTPTPPSDTSQNVLRKENIVTYTVAEECNTDTSPDEGISPYSLAEAEAQAVLILEAAIDSALDESMKLSADEASGLSSPSSLTEDCIQSDVKGEIVIVNTDVDKSPVMDMPDVDDKVGLKLDESEVMISNASIIQDEPGTAEEELGSRFETTLEETMETEPHVSVINVEEDEDEVLIVDTSFENDNNETADSPLPRDQIVVETPLQLDEIVAETPLQRDRVVVETPIQTDQISVVAPPTSFSNEVPQFNDYEKPPLSLTIEGTTIEATDVDDLDSSSNLQQSETKALSTSSDSGFAKDSPVHAPYKEDDSSKEFVVLSEAKLNGVRRNSSSRASDRSDSDTTNSTIGSDKENRPKVDDLHDVQLRTRRSKMTSSQGVMSETDRLRNQRNKEELESIALRKKTRKRTRKFVIDGVTFTTTTSKVIYGDDEEFGTLSSAHLARKQELRELKVVQRQEQKQFQELAIKASASKLEQEKKFEMEKSNLIRNYDSQVEALTRQQKQMVEKAESRQEYELKIVSKKTRNDQEKELKSFRDFLKQEWKLLKQEIDLVPKEHRKETLKIRKDHLEKDQTERERSFLERLNDSHETALKRLNDEHRKHIALKERQFLEEKHQLLRARESAIWDMEERQIQDKHQLAKEQLKDIYFLQRYQMAIRHNVEQEQVKRLNGQKDDALVKSQQVEKRQLPKRIRQEMRTRDKMFREQMRISMTTLSSHEDEKDQIRKFQEQEKIKYDKERKRAELKHHKLLEELRASSDSSIKELIHLQNEKGKLLTEHESYKLKSLDEEYQKDLKEWKSNLAPRKQKLEEGFERHLVEQERFYGDHLDRELGFGGATSGGRSSARLSRVRTS